MWNWIKSFFAKKKVYQHNPKFDTKLMRMNTQSGRYKSSDGSYIPPTTVFDSSVFSDSGSGGGFSDGGCSGGDGGGCGGD